jgi:hypothetical protein
MFLDLPDPHPDPLDRGTDPHPDPYQNVTDPRHWMWLSVIEEPKYRCVVDKSVSVVVRQLWHSCLRAHSWMKSVPELLSAAHILYSCPSVLST